MLVVEQSAIGDERGPQAESNKDATELLPPRMQQRLAARDVDMPAPEPRQSLRRRLHLLARQLAVRALATAVFAVDATQIAAPGQHPRCRSAARATRGR